MADQQSIDLANKLLGAQGEQALNFAISRRQPEAALALIEMGSSNPKLRKMLDLPNEKGDAPLHLAFMAKMPQAASALIRAGADVAAEGEDGQTALNLAIDKGMEAQALELVKAAVAKGKKCRAVLDQADSEDQEPLLRALAAKQESLAVALAQAGAELGISDPSGDSPLNVAIDRGCAQAALALIAASKPGADMLDDTSSDDSQEPLIRALGAGMEEVAIALLERGAEPDLSDADGNGLLCSGLAQGRMLFCSHLIQMCKDGKIDSSILEATDTDGKELILLALEMGDQASATGLMEAGADLDLSDSDGNSLLAFALREGRLDFCMAAIERAKLGKADSSILDASDEDGLPALLLALDLGHEQAAIAMMDSGADLAISDSDGDSLFAYAYARGRTAFCDAMAAAAAKDAIDDDLLDATDHDNQEPILLAVAAGDGRMAIALMDGGANLEVADDDGNSLLSLAVRGGHLDFCGAMAASAKAKKIDASLLDSTDSQNLAPLLIALEEGHEDLAMELMDAGAELDIADGDGNSLLPFALSQGSRRFCSALARSVKAGEIDASLLDATDKDNWPAILLAIVEGDEGFAIELMDSGADLDVADDEGNSLLPLAYSHGLSRFCSALVQSAKDEEVDASLLDATDKDDWPTILVALTQGDDAFCSDLLDAGAGFDIADPDGNDLFALAWKDGMESFCRRAMELAAKESIDRSILAGTDSEGRTALRMAIEDEDADGCVALLFAGAQPGGEVDGASLLCAMIKKGMEPAALAMAALLPGSEHVRRAADKNGSYAFFLAQEDMPRVAQAILDGGCNPWPASPSNRAGLDSPSFAGRVQASGLLPPDPARLAALRDELDPFKPNPLDDPEHPANHPATDPSAHWGSTSIPHPLTMLTQPRRPPCCSIGSSTPPPCAWWATSSPASMSRDSPPRSSRW